MDSGIATPTLGSSGWTTPMIATSGYNTPVMGIESSIARLSLEPEPKQAFRFFDLPSELRSRIYELALVLSRTIDLDPTNSHRISPRLEIFLTCHRMHEEAYRVFYGQHTFRLFPIHGRFFHTNQPLLARLSPRYRAAVTTVELRLGPGWGKPPKCWNTSPRLGLADCSHLRQLKIFVEIDPSDDIFRGFRVADNFYTVFSKDLVQQICEQVPSLKEVQFDAYPAVQKSAPLVQELLAEVKGRGKKITWGPLRGWDEHSEDAFGRIGLEDPMALMKL
ncbi:hypothetical protein BJ546DRAFT_1000069 [Cryomyces antarcticus]